MLGTGRLLSFSFRALVLLLLLPLLWLLVAEKYNQGLALLARPLLSDDISLVVAGTHIHVQHAPEVSPITIDGLTLHYGLVLLAVLVLAAVGVGVVARIAWLIGMGAGAYILHVVGLAMMGWGLAWAYGGDSPGESADLVFSLFAVFWGLVPPLAGGAWALLYWLPRLSEAAPAAPAR